MLVSLPLGPLLFCTWLFGVVCGFIVAGLLAARGRDIEVEELKSELREAREAEHP